MNIKRKEAALRKIAVWEAEEKVASAEDVKQLLEQDTEHGVYPQEEIAEIFEAWEECKKDPGESNNPEKSEKPAAKSGFTYPEYDLWNVNVENLQSDKDGNSKQAKLTCIKKLREKVKLEDNAANSLNVQSHNSRRKYYLSGTVTNGHEEIITIF